MKPLSVLNKMHASKKLRQSNRSRESLLKALDKAISKDLPDSIIVVASLVASVCGHVVAPLPLLLDACCLLDTVFGGCCKHEGFLQLWDVVAISGGDRRDVLSNICDWIVGMCGEIFVIGSPGCAEQCL